MTKPKIDPEASYKANEDLYQGVTFVRSKGEYVSGTDVIRCGWADKVSKVDAEVKATTTEEKAK